MAHTAWNSVTSPCFSDKGMRFDSFLNNLKTTVTGVGGKIKEQTETISSSEQISLIRKKIEQGSVYKLSNDLLSNIKGAVMPTLRKIVSDEANETVLSLQDKPQSFWDALIDDENIKSCVKQLIEDPQTFLIGAPSSFQFDLNDACSIASDLLKENEQLSSLRYELVPRRLSEETFWRNFFYRASLLIRSAHENRKDSVVAADKPQEDDWAFVEDNCENIDDELDYLIEVDLDKNE